MQINQNRTIDFSPDTVIKADSGVTSFVFEIPPEMSEWTWKIIYMNADGDCYEVSCVVEDNSITWDISDGVTAESGRVAFTIEATTTGKVWHTKQYSFYVERSLAHGGTVTDSTYEQVADLVDSAGQYAVRAETAAQTAEAVRVSFSATVQPKSGGGAVVTVTDQNGTTTADLDDGPQGPAGDGLTVESQRITFAGRTKTVVYIKNANTDELLDTLQIYDGSDYVLTQADIQGIEADLQTWCETNILGGAS